jgi:flavin-dependent thymidylate synthase
MIKIKVDLIDATQAAVDKLIYTKSTRLEQGDDTRAMVQNMTEKEKSEQLKYMANTIPSSWEFISYTFEVKNVTRAFTHQFVRTRTGSYAQQTMRMLNKKEFTYRIPPRFKAKGMGEALKKYKDCMKGIQKYYDSLIEVDMAEVEDARGVLPTNIHTNIIAQFSLRTIADMARSRTGLRTQDEYREVLDAMLDNVLEIHPWAEVFLFPEKFKNIKIIENFVTEQLGDGGVPEDKKFEIMKALDKLRKGDS